MILSKLWKTTPPDKKSRAQSRPALVIPPNGIGPVQEPNENDVLCGRGARINLHLGNVKFRKIVNKTKKKYLSESTRKPEKAHIAANLVQQIRRMDPPGRFLKEDRTGGPWYDIGDAKAIKKVGQALREDAPDIRQQLKSEEGSTKKGGDVNTTKKQEVTCIEPKKESINSSENLAGKKMFWSNATSSGIFTSVSARKYSGNPSSQNLQSIDKKGSKRASQCTSNQPTQRIMYPDINCSGTPLLHTPSKNVTGNLAPIQANILGRRVNLRELATSMQPKYERHRVTVPVDMNLTQIHRYTSMENIKSAGSKSCALTPVLIQTKARVPRSKKTGRYSEKAMEVMSQNCQIPCNDSTNFCKRRQTNAFGRQFYLAGTEGNLEGSTLSGLSSMSSIREGSIVSTFSAVSSLTTGTGVGNHPKFVEELQHDQSVPSQYFTGITDVSINSLCHAPVVNTTNSFYNDQLRNNTNASPVNRAPTDYSNSIMQKGMTLEDNSKLWSFEFDLVHEPSLSKRSSGSSLDLGSFMCDDIALGSSSQYRASEFGSMTRSSFSDSLRGCFIIKPNAPVDNDKGSSDHSILETMSAEIHSLGGDLSILDAMSISLTSHKFTDTNSVSLKSHHTSFHSLSKRIATC